jgi:hypothetical protein
MPSDAIDPFETVLTERCDERGQTQARVASGMHSAQLVGGQGGTMSQRVVEPVSTHLLKIGLEVFPVYGDEVVGWSMDPVDLTPDTPKWLRYDSIDELFFALLNLNVAPEGEA